LLPVKIASPLRIAATATPVGRSTGDNRPKDNCGQDNSGGQDTSHDGEDVGPSLAIFADQVFAFPGRELLQPLGMPRMLCVRMVRVRT